MSAPHAALLMVSSGGPPDPYIAYVVNLTHFNDATSATTFVNSVGSGDAFTANASNARTSATQSKFGGRSLQIPDNAANALTPTDTDYGMGTGDFAVEFWLWLDDVTGVKEFNDWRPVNSNGLYFDIYTNGSDIAVWINNADRITGGNGTLVATTWQYICLTRTSGVTRLYVGTSGTAAKIGSDYSDSNNYPQANIKLGLSAFSNSPSAVCYIDEYRVTKGHGRGYTGATIPVPTAAFPNY